MYAKKHVQRIKYQTNYEAIKTTNNTLHTFHSVFMQ